jgi:diguanylate cyclase
LLRHADIAMYAAKRGKAGFAHYDSSANTYQQDHLSLLGELRRAVELNELKLFYQPKVLLARDEVSEVEALLRWNHPVRGFVPPNEFIPFAEQTGYIKDLTQWVLQAAIRQCGEWIRQGMALRISVNISPPDLLNRDLPAIIAKLLAAHQVPAELLCLEITESGFMEDPAQAKRILLQLHEIGVHLSIDDYGTGYSSLSYIAQLPVDELKIDRAFVSSVSTNSVTAAIVRSTIELGHNLGMSVVAEGVEDAACLETLKQLGCDQVQGFLISKALPADAFEAWLRGNGRKKAQAVLRSDDTGTTMQVARASR